MIISSKEYHASSSVVSEKFQPDSGSGPLFAKARLGHQLVEALLS